MTPTINQQEELLDRITQGNSSAKAFLLLIAGIITFWDTLIDRDRALSDAEINARMWSMLIDLPRNQFYAVNFQYLNALFPTAICNWEAATKMERTNADDYTLNIAYIIRSSYVDIVVAVALLLGGREHAVAVAEETRKLVHSEGFAEFKNALTAEKAIRGDA